MLCLHCIFCYKRLFLFILTTMHTVNAVLNKVLNVSKVWNRSTHAKKINLALNDSCRCITECLKPTNTDSLYILSGIAPPNIRRTVVGRKERTSQVVDQRHPLYNQTPACDRLRSRKSFLATTKPLDQHAASTRMQKWKERIATEPMSICMELSPVKSYLQVLMCHRRTGA